MIGVIVAVEHEQHVKRTADVAAGNVRAAIASGAEELTLLMAIREGDVVVVDEVFTWTHFRKPVAEWCLQSRSAQTRLFVLGEFTADERAALLNAGADDVQSGTISTNELVARMHAAVRPEMPARLREFDDGYLKVDTVARSVSRNGTRLSVHGAEFELLKVLLRLAPSTVPIETLEACLRRQKDARPRLRSLINHLQRRIGRDRLQTVHGVGYRYIPLERNK